MTDQQTREQAAADRAQAAREGRSVDPSPDARGQVVRDDGTGGQA